MTPPTNPALSGEELDLDKLEALFNAATPGDWEAQRHGVIVAGPMRRYANGSARSQIAAFTESFHEDDPENEPDRKQANTAFCVAAKNSMPALIAQARAARQARPVDVPADLAYLLEYIPVGAVLDEAKRKLAALAGVQAATSPAVADEQKRRGRESTDFADWWASSGQQAAHDVVTENAAHATWQERGRRAALAQAAPAVATDDFAVRFIEQRAEQYLQDHADTEPGTGALAFEFGEAGREYYSTLVELADDIRKAQADSTAVCTVPPAGWACTRAAGHDGPCAAIPAVRATVVAPTVPAGYVLVPREPTREMLDAARLAWAVNFGTAIEETWTAMVKATPAAQAQPAGAGTPSDATEAAELQTLLISRFADCRRPYPAGLFAWAAAALARQGAAPMSGPGLLHNGTRLLHNEGAAPASAGVAPADIERIANDLESEAIPYEGDFADSVRGAIEDLRALAAPTQPAAPAATTQAEAFCNANCMWTDHAPGCDLAAPRANNTGSEG